MTRNRWMKFWPADWRADPALAKCSLAARGLWIDCIALMHDAEPYGHLLIAGEPPTPRDLARILGAPHTNQVVALLGELRAAGVFSERPWPGEPGGDGGGDSRGMVGGTVGGRPDNTPQDTRTVIYSRRMVRDAQASDNARENGRRGGNPSLKGVKGQVKPALKLEAEAEAEAEILTPSPPKEGGEGVSTPDGAEPRPAQANGGKPPKRAKPEITQQLLNDMAAAWNGMARIHGLPQVSEVTAKRAAALRARINERWSRDPMGMWTRYLEAIAASPFLRGENPRGWKANIDWAIRPDSPVRVAEGKYSDDEGAD